MSIKYIFSLSFLFLSIFYCLLYILRDIYFTTQNLQMKKSINKLLPFFTKYNSLFLFLALICLFFNFYISKYLFIVIIITIILNIFLIYIPIKKFNLTNCLRLLSYIFLIEVILMPII